MTDRLRMTTVGSFPKPDELRRSRTLVARDRLDPKELERLEREATTYWIRAQEEMGLDVLVDGEMYRGDMVTYFSEHMEGFQISGLVRSYGNRYYRKPVAVAPVGRRSSVTVDWWRYSQGLTSKPVKGMVTGPYTMADWSFNEHYSTREEFVMAMAEMVHEEVADLERAGAKYIQIDEPAVSTRPQEMELAAKALGVVTKGITATTITHICYGDFVVVFDQLLRLPVDVLDLEAANSDYQLLELFRKHKTDKSLSLGVTDVHTHHIETLEEVKAGVLRGMELFPPERLYISPDCGLKTRTTDEALAKMQVMADAVHEVKAEQGLT